jgi:hypothetical protein
VLEAIASESFQTELGQFNIEINVAPEKLARGGLDTFETTCARASTRRSERLPRSGAHQVMIGILPTLAEGTWRPEPSARTRATSC